jgi:hypothetical protein
LINPGITEKWKLNCRCQFSDFRIQPKNPSKPMKLRKCAAVAIALVSTVTLSHAAIVFNGSGTSGFGGPVGNSTMSWSDDGTTISVTFTKGAGNFNDRFVLYLDSGASGRTSIDTQINDRADGLRSAISFMESATGKTLSFSSGFEATHAIAIDTGFGGLWSIPSTGTVGNNGLGYIDDVNSTLTVNTQSVFTFSFDVAALGITPNSGSTINFAATYLNPFGGAGNLGYASNEGYGGGFPATNIEQNDFAFTSFNSYTIIPEPTAGALGLIGAMLLLRRRK